MKNTKQEVFRAAHMMRLSGGSVRSSSSTVATSERAARVERMLGLINGSKEFTVANSIKIYKDVTID